MICATCGRDNPSHLVFCQECGQRLAPRGPTSAQGAAPEPKASAFAQTAMASESNAPPAQHTRPPAPSFDFGAPQPPPSGRGPVARALCGRCGAWNEAGIRFCVTCGNGLAVSARPQPAPAPSPLAGPAAIAPARVIAVTPPEPAPPEVRVCARCRGANDPGAQFCRFCGTSIVAQAPPAAPPLTDPLPPAPVAAAAMPDIPAAPPLPAAPPRPSSPDPREAMNETSQLHGFSPALRPSSAGEPLPRARLVIISKDGGEGPSFPVGESIDIGRAEGQVTIPDDRYLSPRHARIVRKPDPRTGASSSPRGPQLVLRDLGSVNGVFLRLRHRDASHDAAAARESRPDRPADAPPTVSLAHPLRDQDLFLVGQQVLRFEVVNDADEGLGQASQHGTLLFGSPTTPRYARLCQRTVEGVTRDVFYIRRAETVLGRESGDVVFTEDPFLSRRHASLRVESGRVESDPRTFLLTDLGSSNGTFVQIRGEVALENGDQFRVGQQLFRIDIG